VELRRLSTDVSSGQFGLEPSAPVPLPADHAGQRETLRTLTSCLAELSPEYREVLILRRIAGCSAEYTAERMGRSVGAVNMLVARAEARLLGLMASRGHSPEDP
jgi:RNA polymerase sigma factor (sigma-70 family)